MARFSFNEADNYGGQGGSFFSLKDDGDTAKIRFLINDINDMQGVATHQVEVNGKQVDVECLRAYNEPVINCPLCEAGYKVNAKMYIPVYDINAKESKIWTRGRTFFKKLSSLCSRYNPLVSMPFEIERVGKKGDTNTTYETYPLQQDNAILADFPEVIAEGVAFEVKSYDELKNFVETGTFEQLQPRQRIARGSEDVTNRNSREIPVRRRPIQNEEDTF